MHARHRAQFVLHEAPGYLRGIAALLGKQRIGNPSFDAGLAFMSASVTALARQMERALAVQDCEQECRRVAQAEEVEKLRTARPKRVRKPAKRRKAGKA